MQVSLDLSSALPRNDRSRAQETYHFASSSIAEVVTSSSIAGVVASEVSVLFTPHLAPMNRGMLATCYLDPVGAATTAELLDQYRSFYADELFVVVGDGPPSTKACLGSNTAHVTVRSDPRTGRILALAAIDNLTKGASGQAVQCANILAGLDESTGLSCVGVYP